MQIGKLMRLRLEIDLVIDKLARGGTSSKPRPRLDAVESAMRQWKELQPLIAECEELINKAWIAERNRMLRKALDEYRTRYY